IWRLAKAAILRAADRDIEADGVTRNVRQSVLFPHVARGPADHGSELDLVIGPSIGFADHDPLAGTDEGARRLQKETSRVDRHRVRRRVVVQPDIGPYFVEVLLVIDRRGDELTGVGDGTEKRHARKRSQRGVGANRSRPRHYLWQLGDEQIVLRERVSYLRQHVERRRDVAHSVTFDD